MLSRTRLRRVAIASLQDEAAPFGSDCDDTGPIWENCNGDLIDIHDSPAGWLGDVIDGDDYNAASFPALAVYVDGERWAFQGEGETNLRGNLSLIVDIYACSDSEWGAEDTLDEIQSRILHRLFRQTTVTVGADTFPAILDRKPESLTVRNERTRGGDRILYMRQLELVVGATECIVVPDCVPIDPICFDPVTTPATCGP